MRPFPTVEPSIHKGGRDGNADGAAGAGEGCGRPGDCRGVRGSRRLRHRRSLVLARHEERDGSPGAADGAERDPAAGDAYLLPLAGHDPPAGAVYTSVAIAGFLCLAAAAIFLRDLLGRDRAPARIGAFTIGAGALLWITGSVLQLGGHRAVGLMATHANPIETTNSIAFTIDAIADAFALAAFALIGAGMLAFAVAAAGERPGHRAWAGCTIVVALAMLVTAGSYAAANGSLSDVMLLADGAVLVPLWLIWTGHTGGFQAERPGVRPGTMARARASS